MSNNISKGEYDATFDAINRSLSAKVEEIQLSNNIPTLKDTEDNNKVFRGKLSVLFVDMRKSLDLTDEVKARKMVKIYRSFIRMVIQAIRYSGGEVRQFAGDGVMGVFQDDIDGANKVTSSEKAVKASRYIITMMDYCLNPLLSKSMDGLSIACGVGVCTGTVLVTKVGMRGKEQDDTSENEMGLVWTGKTTNYASRYCSLANSCEIFIDGKTYSELSDKTVWNKCNRVKGNKAFSGYITHEHYLDLDSEIKYEPVKAANENKDISFVQDVFEETQKRGKEFVDNFLKTYGDMKLKDFNLAKREESITKRENVLNKSILQNEIDVLSDCIRDIIDKLDRNQIQSLGKDFFIERINSIKSLQTQIGSHEFRAYEASAFCEIYIIFEMRHHAYEMICIMAKNGYYISEKEIQFVVNYYDTSKLKKILLDYYYQNDTELADHYNKFADMLED